MSSVLDQVNDWMASLWISPCTPEELAKRFSVYVYWIYTLLEPKLGVKLYQKGDTWYCYKSTAKMLNDRYDYELDLDKLRWA